mmetsp:Transcript_24855/g.44246  ORF Transcript_24855/g.44246 Transcript_24855/m.44246 type:complete len:151 (-) Transcript_24855:81-533(-)
MQGHITKEAEADLKKQTWCESEQGTNTQTASNKASEIVSLEGCIGELETRLDSPETGLKVNLSTAEADLTANQEVQATETSMRQAETAEYQKSVGDLQVAQELITKGTKMLKDYYNSLAKDDAVLLQVSSAHKDEPEDAATLPPKAAESS